MPRNFENWLSTMRESIADYKYYIDFETVYSNLAEYENGLNLLNGLIGKRDQEFDNKFEELLNRYHEDILKCIPILLAKREKEIYYKEFNEYQDSFEASGTCVRSL